MSRSVARGEQTAAGVCRDAQGRQVSGAGLGVSCSGPDHQRRRPARIAALAEPPHSDARRIFASSGRVRAHSADFRCAVAQQHVELA